METALKIAAPVVVFATIFGVSRVLRKRAVKKAMAQASEIASRPENASIVGGIVAGANAPA